VLRDLSRQAAAGTRISLRVSRPEFHSNSAMPCPVADATQAGSKAVQMTCDMAESGGCRCRCRCRCRCLYQLSIQDPSSSACQQPP
jgi:hypothetical protein